MFFVSGFGDTVKQECKYLVKSAKMRGGYYCGCVKPCIYLENVSMICPIIHLAREYEARIVQHILSGGAVKEVNKVINSVNKTT